MIVGYFFVNPILRTFFFFFFTIINKLDWDVLSIFPKKKKAWASDLLTSCQAHKEKSDDLRLFSISMLFIIQMFPVTWCPGALQNISERKGFSERHIDWIVRFIDQSF